MTTARRRAAAPRRAGLVARRRAAGGAVALTVVLAGLAVAAGLQPADASALRVTATTDVATDHRACTRGPLAVSSSAESGASTTQISVTTSTDGPLDAACVGRRLSVLVLTADDTGERLVDVSVESAPERPVFTVDFPTSQASIALVTIDGFAIPTTWVAPAQPPAPVQGCTVFDASGNPATASGYTCTVSFIENWWAGNPLNGAFDFTLSQGLPAGGHVVFTAQIPPPPSGSWANATVVANDSRLTILSSASTLPFVTGQHSAGYNTRMNFEVSLPY